MAVECVGYFYIVYLPFSEDICIITLNTSYNNHFHTLMSSSKSTSLSFCPIPQCIEPDPEIA